MPKPTQRGLSVDEIKERGMEPIQYFDPTEAIKELTSAISLSADQDIPNDIIDSGKPINWPEGFDYQKNPSMSKVDKRLINIIKITSQSFPLRTSVYSGWRPKSYSHTAGRAIDIILYDQRGKKLPNYQDPAMWRIYELFGQKSKFIQMRLYPELNNTYEWGGYFGDNGKWKYKYGSCDLMHFNIDPRGGSAYRAGSLRTGLVGYYKDFYAKNSIIGPSAPMTTEKELDKEIYEKLNNFVLPDWYKPKYYPSLLPIPDKQAIMVSSLKSSDVPPPEQEYISPSKLQILKIISYSASEKSLTVEMSNGEKIKRLGGSLSWRYNNPGNLKYGSFAKNNGSIGPGWSDHAVFPSLDVGKQAQKNLLFDGSTVYSKLSLLDAIKRYAPSSDGNAPKTYALYIARRSGVSLDTKLMAMNENQREKMVSAMITFEGYVEGKLIRV